MITVAAQDQQLAEREAREPEAVLGQCNAEARAQRAITATVLPPRWATVLQPSTWTARGGR